MDDLQVPDEARPAKRARLEAPLSITEETQEEMIDDDDDWDDIYSSNTKPDLSLAEHGTDLTESDIKARDSGTAPSASTETPTFQPPVSPFEPPNPVDRDAASGAEDAQAEAVDKEGDELVAEKPALESTDPASEAVLHETTHVRHEILGAPGATDDVDSHGNEGNPAPDVPIEVEVDNVRVDRPQDDAEFIAAAAAQKGDQSAEWQYDTSDAESSDSDSSDTTDSDDSDSSSDDGYELLDPATAAKMLMLAEGDDNDGARGKDRSDGDHQPRTTNEVKETVVPKPDVTITPEMKITLLGHVETMIEKMILIKGATPGEYQVLESGSVLCSENREVIGAVADTFGKVQEPRYTVEFTNEKELEEAGLEVGTPVFYVDSHSTFVFTQPLLHLKGTDASNIHDEEVGEDEMEFSDDEVEAEYKRQKKWAKKGGNAPLSRSAFQQGVRHSAPHHEKPAASYGVYSDAPHQAYGGALSYDDEEPSEFYQPLKRPDNLSQLMAGGAPPARPPAQTFERGRGRGRGDSRGRGRGDRGRGRGGFGRGNPRGGRGGHDSSQQTSHRGVAHSFPDRHNSQSTERAQHPIPTRPEATAPAEPSGPPQRQQQELQQPSAQTYQFNGYQFQYGAQAPTPTVSQGYMQQQPSSIPSIGQYPVPAYYQQQAQQQQAYPAYPVPQQHQQYPQYAGSAAAPQQPVDIADILRRLGAEPRQ